jgi:anti-anti-sigma factor
VAVVDHGGDDFGIGDVELNLDAMRRRLTDEGVPNDVGYRLVESKRKPERKAGRLDSSAASTAEEGLLVALGGVPPRLAVDMTGLSYISSAGLRVLLVVAKKVQQQHGKLALFGLGPNVREVFTVSGFDTIFSIAADPATALAAVR